MTYQHTETLVYWSTDLLAVLLRTTIMILLDLAIWIVPNVGRGLLDGGWVIWLVLRLAVRLIVAAGRVVYRRWKYRHIKAQYCADDDFITAPFTVVVA